MVQIDANDLRELLAFVHAYAHLYETLNVEFFYARVYDRIDAEWLSFMCCLNATQLNTLPIDFEQYTDCPASLHHFFASARRLSLLDEYSTPRPPHNDGTSAAPTVQQNNASSLAQTLRKVKRKKAHELDALSELVLSECATLGIDRVVDIGCGLGHLGRMLRLSNETIHQHGPPNSDCSPLDYVGIEANPALCHSAVKNDVKMENIVFGSDNSSKQCHDIITLPGHRTALVSLHGCGELQRQILLQFVSMYKQQHLEDDDDQQPQGQCHPQLLVTIGCCYHKLKDWTASTIDRWMLSCQMRHHFISTYGHHHFPIPGLRLACQAKLVRWMSFTEQQHIAHRQAFANRAFVECLRMHRRDKQLALSTAGGCNNTGNGDDDSRCDCVGDVNTNDLLQHRQRRPARKLNKIMIANNNVNEFRSEVLRRSAVLESEREQFEQTLDQIMHTHGPAIRFIEPFTALQFALQCPLESLVLLDRLLFLQENGICAELVQLFDPAISPRNIAIVARANSHLA